jgi:hypothetical protein
MLYCTCGEYVPGWMMAVDVISSLEEPQKMCLIFDEKDVIFVYSYREHYVCAKVYLLTESKQAK